MSFPSVRPYHRLHLILLSVFYQPTFNHFDHFTSAFLLLSSLHAFFLIIFFGQLSCIHFILGVAWFSYVHALVLT